MRRAYQKIFLMTLAVAYTFFIKVKGFIRKMRSAYMCFAVQSGTAHTGTRFETNPRNAKTICLTGITDRLRCGTPVWFAHSGVFAV